MMRYAVTVAAGLAAIVAGVLAFFLLADATRNAILDEMVIDSKSHKNYNDWATDWDADDQALYYDIYLFNLTNPVEWESGAAKANFAEVGPFVYRRYATKTDVSFTDDGDSVTWKNHNEYIFQEDRSVSSDTTTMIFNINPIYVTAIQSAGTDDNFNTNLAVAALAYFATTPASFGSGTNSHTTTPGFYELYQLNPSTAPAGYSLSTAESTAALSLFTGNARAFLTFSGYVSAYNSAVTAGATATAAGLAAAINATFPNAPDFWTTQLGGTTNAALFITYVKTLATNARASLANSVGANNKLIYRYLPARTHIFGPDPLFYTLNSGAHFGYFTNHSTSTAAGKAYTVKTGKRTEDEAGMDHYTQVNGVDTTSTAYVRADGSGPTVAVNGRTRSMVPSLGLKRGDTPATIPIYFEETEQIYQFNNDGVQEIEGIEATSYLADIEEITALNSEYNITDAGFAPLRYWARGIPLYLSLPHQRFSATPYSTAITGMSPDVAAHTSYVHLEPVTGQPMRARLCVQVNLQLNFTAKSYSDVASPTEADMMAPLYWYNKHYQINSETAKDLKRAVVTAVILRRALLGVLVALGCVLVLVGLVLMAKAPAPAATPAAAESDKTTAPKKTPENEPFGDENKDDEMKEGCQDEQV